MKSSLLIIGIIVLVAIFGMFSFWPSIIEAHYGGSVSCPLISMDNSSGCQDMSNHLNDLTAHISNFLSMISAIFIGSIFSLFVLCSVRISRIKYLIINLFLRANDESKIDKSFNDLGFIATFLYIVSSGLRRGIINTKVF